MKDTLLHFHESSKVVNGSEELKWKRNESDHSSRPSYEENACKGSSTSLVNVAFINSSNVNVKKVVKEQVKGTACKKTPAGEKEEFHVWEENPELGISVLHKSDSDVNMHKEGMLSEVNRNAKEQTKSTCSSVHLEKTEAGNTLESDFDNDHMYESHRLMRKHRDGGTSAGFQTAHSEKGSVMHEVDHYKRAIYKARQLVFKNEGYQHKVSPSRALNSQKLPSASEIESSEEEYPYKANSEISARSSDDTSEIADKNYLVKKMIKRDDEYQRIKHQIGDDIKQGLTNSPEGGKMVDTSVAHQLLRDDAKLTIKEFKLKGHLDVKEERCGRPRRQSNSEELAESEGSSRGLLTESDGIQNDMICVETKHNLSNLCREDRSLHENPLKRYYGEEKSYLMPKRAKTFQVSLLERNDINELKESSSMFALEGVSKVISDCNSDGSLKRKYITVKDERGHVPEVKEKGNRSPDENKKLFFTKPKIMNEDICRDLRKLPQHKQIVNLKKRRKTKSFKESKGHYSKTGQNDCSKEMITQSISNNCEDIRKDDQVDVVSEKLKVRGTIPFNGDVMRNVLVARLWIKNQVLNRENKEFKETLKKLEQDHMRIVLMLQERELAWNIIVREKEQENKKALEELMLKEYENEKAIFGLKAKEEVCWKERVKSEENLKAEIMKKEKISKDLQSKLDLKLGVIKDQGNFITVLRRENRELKKELTSLEKEVRSKELTMKSKLSFVGNKQSEMSETQMKLKTIPLELYKASGVTREMKQYAFQLWKELSGAENFFSTREINSGYLKDLKTSLMSLWNNICQYKHTFKEVMDVLDSFSQQSMKITRDAPQLSCLSSDLAQNQEQNALGSSNSERHIFDNLSQTQNGQNECAANLEQQTSQKGSFTMSAGKDLKFPNMDLSKKVRYVKNKNSLFRTEGRLQSSAEFEHLEETVTCNRRRPGHHHLREKSEGTSSLKMVNMEREKKITLRSLLISKNKCEQTLQQFEGNLDEKFSEHISEIDVEQERARIGNSCDCLEKEATTMKANHREEQDCLKTEGQNLHTEILGSQSKIFADTAKSVGILCKEKFKLQEDLNKAVKIKTLQNEFYALSSEREKLLETIRSLNSRNELVKKSCEDLAIGNEKLKENLKQKDVEMAELVNSMKALKSEKDELKSVSEIWISEKENLQCLLNEKKNEISMKAHELQKLKQELEIKEEKMNEIKSSNKELHELVSQKDDLIRQCFVDLEKYSKSEMECKILREGLQKNIKELVVLKKQIVGIRESFVQISRRDQELELVFVSMKEEREILIETIKKLESEVNIERSEHKDAQSALEVKRQELKDIIAEKKSLLKDLELKEKIISEKQEKAHCNRCLGLSEVSQKINDLKIKNRALEKAVLIHESQYLEIEKEKVELHARMRGMQSNHKWFLKEKTKEWKKEFSIMDMQMNEMKNFNSSLIDQVNHYNEFRTVVQQHLNLQPSLPLKNIPLSDLSESIHQLCTKSNDLEINLELMKSSLWEEQSRNEKLAHLLFQAQMKVEKGEGKIKNLDEEIKGLALALHEEQSNKSNLLSKFEVELEVRYTLALNLEEEQMKCKETQKQIKAFLDPDSSSPEFKVETLESLLLRQEEEINHVLHLLQDEQVKHEKLRHMLRDERLQLVKCSNEKVGLGSPQQSPVVFCEKESQTYGELEKLYEIDMGNLQYNWDLEKAASHYFCKNLITEYRNSLENTESWIVSLNSLIDKQAERKKHLEDALNEIHSYSRSSSQ